MLEEPVLESDGSSWDADDDFVVMSYSPGEVTGPLAVMMSTFRLLVLKIRLIQVANRTLMAWQRAA